MTGFRRPAIIICFLIISLGLAIYSIGFFFLDIVELKTIDFRFRARGFIQPSSKVVLAAIDEKSLKSEGKWPWPRSKLAELVNNLSKSGADVIAFDMAFPEPDQRNDIEKIIKIVSKLKINNKSLGREMQKLKIISNNDRLLAKAIRNSKSKVVLGWFFHTGKDAREMGFQDESIVKTQEKNISTARILYTHSNFRVKRDMDYFKEVAPEPDISIIAQSTKFSGFFNFRPDNDGVIRWLPSALKFNQKLYAPLSLMALSAYFNLPLHMEIGERGQATYACIGNRIKIPTDEKGRIMINYRGKDHTFPYISVTDILNNRVPLNEFKGKIVIVGTVAMGTFDLAVTPFSNTFPGPEIHANIIDSIIAGNFLKQPEYYRLFDVLAIIFLGTFLGIVLFRLGVITGALFSAGVFMGYSFLCIILFTRNGMVINMVYPSLVVLFSYLSITAYKFFAEEGEKRFIKTAFSTYLAPAVVKQLIESPGKLELGGELRNITAFFSDIQGFTTISEKLSPPSLVELLNEFLTEMTDIILRHEGTVDKFEGDAIIAFFGAPNVLDNHAGTAVAACLDMQARMEELRCFWKTKGKPLLKMRIGLCSGPAVVGNMGSKNRMDYTMMGDTVNTAARLEGVNKIYGIYTLMSEATWKSAGKGIIAREIDSINVIGKKEPVVVYEPLGYDGKIDNIILKTAETYSRGLAAYRSRQWDKALASFEQAIYILPKDGPSKTMLERCKKFKENPPSEGWNGSFTMESK